MLKNLTIKTKLFTLSFITIISFIVLTSLIYKAIKDAQELEKLHTSIEIMKSDILTLRKNEKDFILRKDMKYKDTFDKNHRKLIADTEDFAKNLQENSIDIGGKKEFISVLKEYKTFMFKYIQQQQVIGLNEKDGLYGSLRSSVHNVQYNAKKTRNDTLLAKVYDLRKQEKDFMLRRNLKYVDKFKNKIDSLISTNTLMTPTIKKDLQNYKRDFLALVEAEIKIGLTHKEGIQGEMRSTIHKTDKMLKAVTAFLEKGLKEKISQYIMISIVIAAVLAIFTVLIIFYLSKDILSSLNRFQFGLNDFFKYLNNEVDDVKQLDASSKDEIGVMSKTVNDNIVNIKNTLEDDKKVINQSIEVLNELEQGDLSQRVTIKTSNPSLSELTSLINKMGENLEKNIENILSVLTQYSNSNFIEKIDNNNAKEHLAKLIEGINTLQESITQMLLSNKENGMTLDKSSNLLLSNVDILNKNSNESAAALEETAAALDEITSNISNNTENVVKMANFANEVTNSANEGEKLAKQTTLSMDEINAQVTSINEAISVIDQIAFQTNILSLNAAVEAATAGEAGKGFAVVAGEVRNLAARSAEAASEIKNLVETATLKANDGKKISDKMIQGYNGLNENITKTIELIKDVEMASKEQQSGIQQINDAVNSLDQQTQQNAMIASQTQDVAIQTDEIAKLVVSDADEKEFRGKNEVHAKEVRKDKVVQKTTTPQKPKVENKPKKDTSEINSIKPEQKEIKSQTSDDEWESF